MPASKNVTGRKSTVSKNGQINGGGGDDRGGLGPQAAGAQLHRHPPVFPSQRRLFGAEIPFGPDQDRNAILIALILKPPPLRGAPYEGGMPIPAFASIGCLRCFDLQASLADTPARA